MAEKLVRRSAKPLRAGLRDDVELRADAASVFGIVRVLQDRELFDGVEARIDDEPIQVKIVVVDAVEQVIVRRFARPCAVHAGIALRRQTRAGGRGRHARRLRGEFERLALGGRQRQERLRSVDVANRAVAGSQRRRVRRDLDLLADVSRRQRDRHDRFDRRQQADVVQDLHLVALTRRDQRVGAGRQTIEGERPIARRRAATPEPVVLIEDDNGAVGDRRARAVANLDQERGGGRLRRRGARRGDPDGSHDRRSIQNMCPEHGFSVVRAYRVPALAPAS